MVMSESAAVAAKVAAGRAKTAADVGNTTGMAAVLDLKDAMATAAGRGRTLLNVSLQANASQSRASDPEHSQHVSARTHAQSNIFQNNNNSHTRAHTQAHTPACSLPDTVFLILFESVY
mmetsp:Transcript_46287/g.67926  ORF Transcript_46287/g.67926 Transcript_46287/m.67926 type:complete len:119 (+) Transcript_46287:2106-2462(+)